MTGYTPNKNLDEQANGASGWDSPLNTGLGQIDSAFGGTQAINLGSYSGGTIVLTDTFPIVNTPLTSLSYIPLILGCFGALIQNVTIEVPSGVGGQWVVENLTSGSFTLTLTSGGGGTSVVCPQRANTTIYSDGTNVSTPTVGVSAGAGITVVGTQVSLTTPITVPLGGTGNTSLTGGYLLVGNGTSAVVGVAPGASGNVATSNGATWISVPPAGGGTGAGAGTVTSVNVSGASTGLVFSGGPVTSSGTITLGGTLSTIYGGTGVNGLTGYVYGTGSGPLAAATTIPSSNVSGLATSATTDTTNAANITSGNLAATRMSTNIISALGFTPYNSSNPSGYVTSSGSVNYASSANYANSAGYASTIPSSYGAVGTYLIAICTALLSPGDTISGASIHANGINGGGPGAAGSGSWLFLGQCVAGYNNGLYLRYA